MSWGLSFIPNVAIITTTVFIPLITDSSVRVSVEYLKLTKGGVRITDNEEDYASIDCVAWSDTLH